MVWHHVKKKAYAVRDLGGFFEICYKLPTCCSRLQIFFSLSKTVHLLSLSRLPISPLSFLSIEVSLPATATRARFWISLLFYFVIFISD
ncbi:hypothetical protein RIF29_17502 [Crotalaria pallida]|uniref:Uncharacterized protein n=1 Tax=Crotalaria pallida TaxID=3830 RepID=A0AAN9FQX1_CROPI